MTVEVVVTRHGRQMYLTSDVYFSPLLEKYGEYNYGETDLFAQIVRPGDTVVDVGANIGCHTLALAKIVGPHGLVMAFEPQLPIYYALCGTMALNEQWQVHACCCALGEEQGTTKIPVVQYSLANSFGGLSIGHKEGHTVPVMPLDHFNLETCKFIKVDVEGAEVEVLIGAADTIKRCRPYLYVENDRHPRSDELIKTMLGMDYQLFLHTPPLFNARNFRGETENVFPNVASIMLLGVPNEKPIKDINLKPIEKPEDMIKFGEHIYPPELRRARG